MEGVHPVELPLNTAGRRASAADAICSRAASGGFKLFFPYIFFSFFGRERTPLQEVSAAGSGRVG